MYNEGILTFQAGVDLVAHRRVKLETGSTTTPPEVVYADAGEQHIGVTMRNAEDGEMVAVKLRNYPGSEEVEAAGTFAYKATLYGAADGKVDDVSSGSAIGVAKEAATAAGDIVEMLPFNVLSTTAATVSVDGSGADITGADVEAAIVEAFVHIQSAQKFIPVDLKGFREVAANDIQNLAAHGGLLASDSTPTLSCANGDTDGCLILTWTAEADEEAIIGSVALPPDLDTTEDLVLHFRAAMEDTNNTPAIALDAYFNEGDDKVSDASAAVTGTSWAEYTITIDASDIPSGAQTLTIELTPAAHASDDLYVNAAAWLEYTGKTLTS
jgi:hypothetical protein